MKVVIKNELHQLGSARRVIFSTLTLRVLDFFLKKVKIRKVMINLRFLNFNSFLNFLGVVFWLVFFLFNY